MNPISLTFECFKRRINHKESAVLNSKNELRQILNSSFQLPVCFSLNFPGFTAIILTVLLAEIIFNSNEFYRLICMRQTGRDFDTCQPPAFPGILSMVQVQYLSMHNNIHGATQRATLIFNGHQVTIFLVTLGNRLNTAVNAAS